MDNEDIITEDEYQVRLQQQVDMRIRQLTTERDNLLELNRILESDRKTLIEDLAEARQVARQSYGDLQRAYMALEKEHHALKLECQESTQRKDS